MIKDFSKYHELISDMFPNIDAVEAYREYQLSEDQISFFKEHGYIHNILMLDEQQIEKLKLELESLIGGQHPSHELFHEFNSNESENEDQVLFHSLGHWRITEGFHDVLWNPRFVVPACQLLGERTVRFWHDQLFCKPAQHGGVVAWHQDYSYWTRTKAMQHLTCWVGLDDASIENGCLQYIPGSHRWPLLEKTSLGGHMDGLGAFLNKDQKKQFENKVAIEMPAGYGSFHHPLLVHGSYENKSSSARRAFVLNVFADGTFSDTNDELLAGVPIIKQGDPMKGQFFPILFDVSQLA